MEKVTEFIKKYWMMIAIAVIVIVVVLWYNKQKLSSEKVAPTTTPTTPTPTTTTTTTATTAAATSNIVVDDNNIINAMKGLSAMANKPLLATQEQSLRSSLTNFTNQEKAYIFDVVQGQLKMVAVANQLTISKDPKMMEKIFGEMEAQSQILINKYGLAFATAMQSKMKKYFPVLN